MFTPDTPPGLTDEQWAVVRHDPQAHATVLAVAGAGKTTAMAHRVRHLIERGCAPRAIRAVMFNRAARKDFERKLASLGVNGVRVQTFNALGHAIVGWAGQQGLCEPLTLLEDWQEMRLVEQALGEWRRGGRTGDPIDPEEASEAIRTWKGLLTPPDHARCTERPALVDVYRRFEALRRKAGRMTFDDQIGEAVRLIQGSPIAQRTLVDRIDHLIIDEFQDVNYAQQMLAQLIAGKRARVMVVGDDDQCIYEWRGARSSYIRLAFAETFTHHPHAEYRLTRSFRFGPTVARVAANVIAHNLDRVPKSLVAAHPRRLASVRVVEPTVQPSGVVRRLLDEGVQPGDMVALVRMFAQSYPLQAQLIDREIPFVVEGERSLLEALPVRVLRAYLALALAARDPLDSAAVEALEQVVDKPNRYVRKRAFSRVVYRRLTAGATVVDCLRDIYGMQAAGITARAADALADMADVLEDAREAEHAGEAARIIQRAFDLGEWLAEWQSEDKVEAGLATLDAFTALLDARQVPLAEVEPFVSGYDTRRGQPPGRCVRITSIFRAKGLEWDHVILPGLVEGSCPHLREADIEVSNVLFPERGQGRTESLEAERRLFYVAVTRAREAVWLCPGDGEPEPSRFIDEGLVDASAGAVGIIQAAVEAGALSAEAEATLARHAARAHLLSGLGQTLERLRAAGAEPTIIDRLRGVLTGLSPATPPPRPAPRARPRRRRRLAG